MWAPRECPKRTHGGHSYFRYRLPPPAAERLQQAEDIEEKMSEKDICVRVHSREGEEVTCSRKAARSAGMLRHMMEDSADGGSYPVDVPAAVLRVILDACNHDDGGFSYPLAETNY